MNEEIKRLIRECSREDVITAVRLTEEDSTKILTIIADATMHSIPQDIIAGQVVEFSEGMLPTEDDQALENAIVTRLDSLGMKLVQNNWSEVRLIYSGHALLAAQIKMLVYRRLYLNTIDYGYFGKHGYRKIDIDFRTDLNLRG